MGEVIQNVFPGRDVTADIVPFVGRDLRQAAFHQRLTRRDDLDDRRMTRSQIGIDGCDKRGGLHRGEQMAEEALFGALEG